VVYPLDLNTLQSETVSQGSGMPTEEDIQHAVMDIKGQGYFYDERAVRQAARRIRSTDVQALLDLLQQVEGPQILSLCHRLIVRRKRKFASLFLLISTRLKYIVRVYVSRRPPRPSWAH
jgi:hypothetical protein